MIPYDTTATDALTVLETIPVITLELPWERRSTRKLSMHSPSLSYLFIYFHQSISFNMFQRTPNIGYSNYINYIMHNILNKTVVYDSDTVRPW